MVRFLSSLVSQLGSTFVNFSCHLCQVAKSQLAVVWNWTRCHTNARFCAMFSRKSNSTNKERSKQSVLRWGKWCLSKASLRKASLRKPTSCFCRNIEIRRQRCFCCKMPVNVKDLQIMRGSCENNWNAGDSASASPFPSETWHLQAQSVARGVRFWCFLVLVFPR